MRLSHLNFDPPGPGLWSTDGLHAYRPVTAIGMANPAFNVVLPQLGAIVTAHGGILSPAAIVARKFGLRAVVGCKDVTEKIADGSYVLVDGDTGTVTVLD